MTNLPQKLMARCPFLTEGTAGGAYDALVALFQSAIEGGESLTLPGIGRFTVRQSPARFGFNPRTRERITIPPKARVKFTLEPAIEVGAPV